MIDFNSSVFFARLRKVGNDAFGIIITQLYGDIAETNKIMLAKLYHNFQLHYMNIYN